ncbi:Membrane-anchored lipid-binding protein YSP2 [Candida viswanathii]|uniref:Membrane-anchored lipid-binding protein YSP2 n=1 Tax=Candida viswanathii TaxID=5486 RepID=A0A367XXW0_9ASCO|nr:Membrane-anchored lipid-binding protein YSP2 [Candida viswanathii]
MAHSTIIQQAVEEDQEDNDPWSYSFPPSTDSLPLLQQQELSNKEQPDSKKPTDDQGSTNGSAVVPSTLPNTDSTITGPSPLKLKVDMKKSNKSSLSFSSTMQKTVPLDPLTTKEDANLVISKDSKNNSLDEESQKSTKPRFMKDLKDTNPDEPKLLPSPQIIAYRKSKRTVSEGMYDSPIEGSPSSPHQPPSSTPSCMLTSSTKIPKLQILDLTDRLVDDFACALSREILLQGRIYLSESYVCFNSNLLGWVTNLVVQLEDIVKVEKRSTAGLFPNAISIETEDGTIHTFASFLSRDQTYDLLLTLWKGATGRTDSDVGTDQTNISEDEANNNNEEGSPGTQIESYILSLDGDDSNGKEDEDDDDDDDEGNEEYNDEDEDKIADEVFDAPMGVVFALLFGPYTKFQTDFLETHDGSEISDFADFHPAENDPAILKEVLFTCEVTETIEHLNFADYIIVVSTTATPDVPLGGVFSVKTRYVFTWGVANKTNLMVYHHQTYFIDGPPAIVKLPSKKKPRKVEVEKKPEVAATAEAPAFTLSDYLRQNNTSVVTIIFTIIMLILYLQIGLFNQVKETNTLVKTQLMLTVKLAELQKTN